MLVDQCWTKGKSWCNRGRRNQRQGASPGWQSRFSPKDPPLACPLTQPAAACWARGHLALAHRTFRSAPQLGSKTMRKAGKRPPHGGARRHPQAGGCDTQPRDLLGGCSGANRHRALLRRSVPQTELTKESSSLRTDEITAKKSSRLLSSWSHGKTILKQIFTAVNDCQFCDSNSEAAVAKPLCAHSHVSEFPAPDQN